MSEQSYKELAAVTKAMAHPTRLHILEILAQDDACVCHLTAILNQRQPYISQQLMVLRDAGLVTDRRDGVMVYYSLSCPCVGDAVKMMHNLLRATGNEMSFPQVPEAPVDGCPCPKCKGRRASPDEA